MKSRGASIRPALLPDLVSDGDDELSSDVSFFQITDGLGDLGERVSPVDDRCELAGLYELGEDGQILVVLAREERAQILPHERGHQARPEQAGDYPQPPSAAFASYDDERSPRSQGVPQARQRRAPGDVEDHVVALLSVGEVL